MKKERAAALLALIRYTFLKAPLRRGGRECRRPNPVFRHTILLLHCLFVQFPRLNYTFLCSILYFVLFWRLNDTFFYRNTHFVQFRHLNCIFPPEENPPKNSPAPKTLFSRANISPQDQNTSFPAHTPTISSSQDQIPHFPVQRVFICTQNLCFPSLNILR